MPKAPTLNPRQADILRNTQAAAYADIESLLSSHVVMMVDGRLADGKWSPSRPVASDCSQPVAAVPHKPSIGRIQLRRHRPTRARKRAGIGLFLIAFATTSIRVTHCETSAADPPSHCVSSHLTMR